MEYTKFDEWKSAGIAAGYAGPTQQQGMNVYAFGHHGLWNGDHGVLDIHSQPVTDSLTNTPVDEPLPEVT